ncbi:MAG: phospholipid carrier-dependent glycosyltransferase, partial [Pseudomonadota bacterium]|nr:phospholipid carrier-dependent glycosyltransferase [Pseudomonadota bacterium]
MKISEGSKIIDLLPRDVCRAAVLLSFILSLWVSFTGGIVNLDGILYLNVADLLGKGDFSGAAELYGWFFYPLLIAGVHKISGFGLEMSAHLLTALFSALLTYAFLACVRELGGNRKILFLAAIIIIFHPVFMEFRAKIFRDHGYLAFYLLGVLCFLKFYGLPLWRYAFLWGLSMLVATLFRIEGLLFLSMLPTAIIFNKSFTLSKRLYHFARAHLVNF